MTRDAGAAGQPDGLTGAFGAFDPARVPSPCHVIDLARLEHNLAILQGIGRTAGVKVLLALKAYACFATAGLIGRYLDGTAASGLWEARLGRTRFGGEVHAYVPGLKAAQVDELVRHADHLIFNTPGQWQRFAPLLEPHRRSLGVGLRINPRHSEVETALYDPCAAWSRLGTVAGELDERTLAPFDGLHVHALCDQGYDPFDRLLAAVEAGFSGLFPHVRWLNLGGGQLLTASDYPVEKLAARLADLRVRTGLELYLEPGTAVALGAGALVTELLDTGWNAGRFAVMDASATCHMPDVIEAPYTPDVQGAETVHAPTGDDARDDRVWRLGGPTCLAGDVIGTYRFARPPAPGDRLMILDQAYYTMVKATTFNGTPLPGLALWDSRTDELVVVREFGYETFEDRLG